MVYSAHICLGGAIVVAALTAMISLPADALRMKECSAKYRAAQSSGSSAGMSWQAFRQANCGVNAYVAPRKTATNTSFPTAILPKFQGITRQGTYAYLPRSIQGQQG